MIVFTCALFWFWVGPLPDDAALLGNMWSGSSAESQMLRFVYAGVLDRYDLAVLAERMAANRAGQKFRRSSHETREGGPTLDDVVFPSVEEWDFYGGDEACDGSQLPGLHLFLQPSYVSLLYRRISYDPGAESWGDERHGIEGEGVGVVYSGFLQRIWGHGFALELEADPINGIHQRIELIHFVEKHREIAPGITIPCIRAKDLYTFHWSVRDRFYQVHRAHPGWRLQSPLGSFYLPSGLVVVAGTPCVEWRGLDGIDAGFAGGGTRLWQTSLAFPWEPCADFLFSAFYLKTQKRASPWPGVGLPLLAFTRAGATEFQRRRSAADLERARATPTPYDRAAGFDPRYLGADRHDNRFHTAQWSREATREALVKMGRLEAELRRLGEENPHSALAGFARFASRDLQDHRLFYVYDMDEAERREALYRKFPAWAADRILHRPERGFSHMVALWAEVDWSAPWKSRRYRQVFAQPNRVMSTARSLAEVDAGQRADVAAIAPTTGLLHRDTDPNQVADWPQWNWPGTRDPDSYWTIYLTWR